MHGEQKYNYKPDWGETFAGKRDPSLVVLNLDNLEFKVLDPLENDMSPGQVGSHFRSMVNQDGYLF
jgi:acylaminoacyl-peptidase